MKSYLKATILSVVAMAIRLNPNAALPAYKYEVLAGAALERVLS
jgi:hypothetical protein